MPDLVDMKMLSFDYLIQVCFLLICEKTSILNKYDIKDTFMYFKHILSTNDHQ